MLACVLSSARLCLDVISLSMFESLLMFFATIPNVSVS